MFLPTLVISLLVYSTQCQTDFSASSRNFSLELLHFTAAQTGGHVVLSPFGIWTLMTGVCLGATGNSRNQLRKAFLLPPDPGEIVRGYQNLTQMVLNPTSNDVLLVSKNFMFLDQDFTPYPEFKKLMQDNFGSAIKILNFNDGVAAAKSANSYIQNSGGKVANVLTSDDFSNSRMILTNVISFKGLWTSPFNKSDTVVEPFYDESGNQIGQVNMMSQLASLSLSRFDDLKAFALELPYGQDGKYSMLIIKPFPRVKVSETYRNFARVSLKDIFDKMKKENDDFGEQEVDLRIPRFKIDTNVVLNKPLNDMGVYDIFDPNFASFDRVSKERLFVSAIVHMAEIEVTESGTVASAATSAILSDRISTPSFIGNSPFIYFIVDKKSTTVIFTGIYSKPTVF